MKNHDWPTKDEQQTPDEFDLGLKGLAREEFHSKGYANCLSFYSQIKDKALLDELDEEIIAMSGQRIAAGRQGAI